MSIDGQPHSPASDPSSGSQTEVQPASTQSDLTATESADAEPIETQPVDDQPQTPQSLTDSTTAHNEAFDPRGKASPSIDMETDVGSSVDKPETDAVPSTSTEPSNPVKTEGKGPQCFPQRGALLKSMLNFLKKAIPDPAFSDSIRHCEYLCWIIF
jgi:hypothetical protein